MRFETGEIAASTNIPLKGVQLRAVLGERLGVPVFVDNDATVAALAEAHDADLKLVSRNLVMITVGTGIGGGVVIDGRIFRGGSGGAGEVGMTLIGLATDPDLPAAGGHFPQPGSLEALSSGHALGPLRGGGGRCAPGLRARKVGGIGQARARCRCGRRLPGRRRRRRGCRQPLGSRAGCRHRQRDQHL